jgi:hypothetical protein
VIRRDALLNELYHLCQDADCTDRWPDVLAQVLRWYEFHAQPLTKAQDLWLRRRGVATICRVRTPEYAGQGLCFDHARIVAEVGRQVDKLFANGKGKFP